MGYRNYIGYIPKKEYNKIKSFNKIELYTYKDKSIINDYLGPYDIIKPLHEFGKYCDFEQGKMIKPFFKSKDLHNEFNSDQEFVIVEKEFLKAVIKNYQEKIKSWYLNLMKDINPSDPETFTKEKSLQMYNHIRSVGSEWLQLEPFDLEKGDEITTSWKYEYGIFELVRIYKSFDWKRNIMVYYGY